jgi:hypothetical protein
MGQGPKPSTGSKLAKRAINAPTHKRNTKRPKALAMAVRNNRTENRFSGLLARLQRDDGDMHERM